jgi:hypothetical protein
MPASHRLILIVFHVNENENKNIEKMFNPGLTLTECCLLTSNIHPIPENSHSGNGVIKLCKAVI